jgi:hypothetical protein
MFKYSLPICMCCYEQQRGYESPEDQIGEVPRISSHRQVVPLITLLYLIMFSGNHCDMLRLIWWDPIGFPSFVYPTPCRQMNYWVYLLLLYLVLGINVTSELWSCSNFVVVLIIVHDKIIMLIWRWSLTWDNSATTRVEWDALGQVIRKARERLPYLKGASREVLLPSIGRFSGRTVCLAFRTRDSYVSFFLKP